MRTIQPETLLEDMRNIIEETERLLHATAHSAGEEVAQARVRAEESLRSARKRLHQQQRRLVARARATARSADRRVRANPWKSIAVAAGIGFLIGYLSAARPRQDGV